MRRGYRPPHPGNNRRMSDWRGPAKNIPRNLYDGGKTIFADAIRGRGRDFSTERLKPASN